MKAKSKIIELLIFCFDKDETKPRSTIYVDETAIIDHGASIGKNCKIWQWVHISSGAIIGSNCIFGQNVFISNKVSIGDNVKIQNSVSVYDNVIIEDDVFVGQKCN